MARKTTTTPETPAEEQAVPHRATLADNFVSAVGLIQQMKRETHLSETTLVRMWELTLMWDLNNRNNQPTFPTFDETEMPEIHEMLTGEAE